MITDVKFVRESSSRGPRPLTLFFENDIVPVANMIVDAPFYPGYLFHFNFCLTLHPFMSRFEFGPRTYSFMLFIYFIESLSHFVLDSVLC